jgi:eukaryotic-like serine/threonine-protein kinase
VSTERMLGVALRLTDGEAVDWDGESVGLEDDDRAVLERLRTLEHIALVHSTDAPAAGPIHESISASARDDDDVPLRWGTLEIRHKIGRGAYGDVYRAWDPRLGREVALKLLRYRTAPSDAEIIREGQLLARVRHHNVVTVFGAATIDGRIGLWMELIRGETLEEELARRGQFTPEEVLHVALELCGALRAVHAAGLLHRDIKAQNVIRAEDGRLVLMDFGTGAEPAEDSKATALAGTPAYLAPEVLAGGSPTESSEVYALGVLLFHLATGTFPVEGQDVAELRRMHRERNRRSIRSLRPEVPAALAEVIDRAVAPERQARFSTIAALQQALTGLDVRTHAAPRATTVAVLGPGPFSGGPENQLARRRTRASVRVPVWGGIVVTFVVVAACLGIGAVLGMRISRREAASDSVRSVRFLIQPPPVQSFTSLAVAPDGRALVYGTDLSLELRRLDAATSQTLPGIGGAYDPFWSADSSQLAFFADRDLHVIDLSNGARRTVCPARRAVGGTWNHAGTIVFAADLGAALYQVTANGGTASAIRRVTPAKGQMAFRYPHFLPDGDRFLYLVRSYDPEVQGIYLGSLSDRTGNSDRRVLASESNAEFSAGHLLTVRAGVLSATPFDAAQGAVIGEPRRVTEYVDQGPYADGYARFSASRDGVLAYKGGRNPNRELRWFDRKGVALGAIGPPDEYRDFELSHDNTRLAVVRLDDRSGMQDLWIRDIRRDSLLRLTADDAHDGAPVWSADDQRLAYGSTRNGRVALYERLASGVGPERLIFTGPGIPFDWSPDGHHVVMEMFTPTGLTDLFFIPASVPGPPQPYVATRATEGEPQFSPDGKWMAYSSAESGRRQVFVEPIPRTGKRSAVSTDMGREPRWRADGKELFFLGADNVLTAASIEVIDGVVHAGALTPLFKVRVTDRDVRYHYAVTADGKRFLVNTVIEDGRATPLNVWVNWQAP